MSLDPRRLLVLRAVHRAGGVLPAARALQLTPSGVSQQLTKLEAQAGIALVDRSRRGGGRALTLTAVGQALADHGEQVAVALANAERELDRFKEHNSRVVRVGGFAAALNRLAAPAVLALSLADPGIDPRIFEIDETAGLGQLAAGELDLLFSEKPVSNGHARPAGLRETDLMQDSFRIVVPHTWSVDNPAELLARPWVLHRTHASRRALERVASAHGITLDIRHTGQDTSTMLALVSAGLGAAIIPALTLNYQARGFVRLHTGPPDPGSRTLTLLQSNAVDQPSVERFAHELQRQAVLIEHALYTE